MIISTFKSVHKAYVDLKLDLPWEQMVDIFSYHYDVEKKDDVELYNLIEFKDVTDPTVELGRKYHYVNGERQETYDLIPNTVRRCINNVVSINGVVLDIDDSMNIKEAIALLDGVEYLLYTTFRHTPEKHKFRVIIPFSRPLLKDDVEGRKESIIETFPGVDNASFTVSQSFYFHSGKTDSIVYHNEGIMIDPYDFEYRERKVYEEPIYTQTTTFEDEDMERYKNAVVESLQSCSGLHYAGKGSNNKGVLTLVSICKSIGLTFQEFDAICVKIADQTSELKRPDVRRNAWTGWDGNKIRKETRDDFIKSYNGKPIVVRREGYGLLTNKKILKRVE